MPFHLWLALILCNLVWAMNPTQAKILIHETGPVWTAWIRYGGAFAAFLIWKGIEWILRRRNAQRTAILLKPRSSSELLNLALLSLCTFVVSPVSQMVGLAASTAVNNALLVALEPLFTVALAWVFLGQKLRPAQWLSFPVAFLGFLLLSGLSSVSLREIGTAKGDLLIAFATCAEAMFSIFSVNLLRHHRASPIFGSAVGLGAIFLFGAAFYLEGPPAFGKLSGLGLGAAFWIGPLGTAVTYLIWLWVLERGVPVGLMALTLFVQPLAGAAAGAFFLREPLTPAKVAGGVLILVAVLAPELQLLFQRRRE